VHELQVAEPGTIPVTGHDVLVDFIVTPEQVIDCRPGRGPRRRPAIDWADLTDEKIAAIPLLTALRAAQGQAGPGWPAATSGPRADYRGAAPL
jgi:5-formyltetrahydrofolate cyclo-ligase